MLSNNKIRTLQKRREDSQLTVNGLFMIKRVVKRFHEYQRFSALLSDSIVPEAINSGSSTCTLHEKDHRTKIKNHTRRLEGYWNSR